MNSQPVPDDVLSAYLADDLDDGDAAVLEARLAGDPELAARLDRLAAMLVELRGTDEVAPPSGFDARLTRRLHAEREHDPARARDLTRLRPAGVSDLGQARRRRAVTQRRWLLGGTAAAAVAAVALVSGLALQQLSGGGTSAGGASAEQEAAGGATSQGGARDRGLVEGSGESAQEEAPASQSTEAGAAQSESADDLAHGTPGRGARPVVLDRQVVLTDEAAVRTRYRDLPEAERLLGVSEPQARAATRSAAAFLRRAAPLADGVAPGDCLPTLPQGDAAPSVPVRVETVIYRGEPALAYVLVEATGDTRAPDRIRVQLLRPDDCSTALSLRL